MGARHVLVAWIAAGCAEPPGEPIEETTDGAMFVWMSEAVDTNMNVEPYEATIAHGKFGGAGYCGGGFDPTCYEWKALSFWSRDEATRVVRLAVNTGGVAPGLKKTFTGPSAYDSLIVEDGYDKSSPWMARAWTAHSGTLTIVFVEGDLVGFNIENAEMRPSFIPPDDETLGTFRVDGSGEIRIERQTE